jgi:hypothetical protein
MASIALKPMRKCLITLGIRSLSPILFHKPSPDVIASLEEKHRGKKTKDRAIRVPEDEAENGCYYTDDGRLAFPGLGLKQSIISAAHKDIGIEKTLVKKALFLSSTDSKCHIPFVSHSDRILQKDLVTIGQGSRDVRYRYRVNEWSASIVFQIDNELLQPADLVTLIDRAGFGVGLCDWRPETGGEYGRFAVDSTVDVRIEQLT